MSRPLPPKMSKAAPPTLLSPTGNVWLKATYKDFLFKAIELLGKNMETSIYINDMLDQWLVTRLSLPEVKAAYAQVRCAHARGEVPHLGIAVKARIKRLLRKSAGQPRFHMNVYTMQQFLESDPEAEFLSENWSLAKGVADKEEAEDVSQILALLQGVYNDKEEQQPEKTRSSSKRRGVVPVKPEHFVQLEPPSVARTPATRVEIDVLAPMREVALPPLTPLQPIQPIQPAMRAMPLRMEMEQLQIYQEQKRVMLPRAVEMQQIQQITRPRFTEELPTGFEDMKMYFLSKVPSGTQNRSLVADEALGLICEYGYKFHELSDLHSKAAISDSKARHAMKSGLFKRIYETVKRAGRLRETTDDAEGLSDKKRISRAIDWMDEYFNKA